MEPGKSIKYSSLSPMIFRNAATGQKDGVIFKVTFGFAELNSTLFSWYYVPMRDIRFMSS
jgi:hypothetical protein